jgi:hypothetical protein
MCRGMRVLCAASGEERLGALKRAAVGTEWELVGGAATPGQLLDQILGRKPDIVVVDAGLWPEVKAALGRRAPSVRVVVVAEPGRGPAKGTEEAEEVASLEGVRAAILGLPGPGGPVRR